ncbi:hypothetical protein BH10ACT1_BH10ACT1_12410 [soil metagenome]
MRRNLNVEIADVARRHAGHVTRALLAEVGVHAAAAARRTATGLLVPVGVGTFRLGSVGRTPFGDVAAATLDTGGVGSHWTAAWLRELVEPKPWVDVTVTRRGPMYQRPMVCAEQPITRVHSSTNLPRADVVERDGIPLTSVARTALGLAARVPFELSRERLGEVVGAMVDAQLATDPWLWWLLAQRRCRGRNGVTELEAVLAMRAELGATESWLEREVLRLVEAAGLPVPTTQRRIARRGRFVARVDFVYEPEHIVVEALGYAHHRTREQLQADTMRANALQLQGYLVLQFGYDQIVGAPASMLATIDEALGRVQHRRAA